MSARAQSADLRFPYVNPGAGPGRPLTALRELRDLGATRRERAAVREAVRAVHEYTGLMEASAARGRTGGDVALQSESADVVLDRLVGDLPLRRRTRLLGVAVRLAQEQGAPKSYVKAGAWRQALA